MNNSPSFDQKYTLRNTELSSEMKQEMIEKLKSNEWWLWLC